jgi:DNA (cytosine-5)-methyltransferase 1
MRSLEIFSGVGGMAQGLKLAGFEHKALLEWNEDACSSLKLNFKKTDILQEDIRAFSFSNYKDVEFIAGGPPCQPFSLGGKHKGQMDSRDMFPYAINGIRELKPKAFVFENVKGLLRESFSSYFNYIILQLTYPEIEKGKDEEWLSHLKRLEKTHTKGGYSGLKYNIVYRLVNAANYGVPQKRERVIIVGIKDSLNISWSFPEETHSQERLLWDKFVTKEYWEKYNVSKTKREFVSSEMKSSIQKLTNKYGFFEPPTKPWITVREALSDLLVKNKISHKDHIIREGARTYAGHTGSYIDQPSKTIKAGDHGVPGGENMIRFEDNSVRYFTVLEAKRIQTFPDDYEISGAWTEAMRQLGNAVPVKLAYTIGQSLITAINKKNKLK